MLKCFVVPFNYKAQARLQSILFFGQIVHIIIREHYCFLFLVRVYLSGKGATTMFITLNTLDQAKKEKTLIVNTSQIAFIADNFVHMGNGAWFEVLDDSMKILNENLYGVESATSPAASEHTTTLLNDLHRLLGGRGEAKPTTDRKARLKSRLKDFSEDELKTAAQNLGTDEFMQGANDSNKRYGTIDYLLRTSANVNKWLEEQPQKKKGMF